MTARGPLAIVALMLLASGCATADDPLPVNPSFDITEAQANRVIRDEATRPRRLPRPLVIVGGFRDPGIAPSTLKDQVHQWTGDDRIVAVAVTWCFSFEDCRRRIIDAVQRAFPSDDPNQTIEVDVIGFSMGGLAARYAAADFSGTTHAPTTRRLRIPRLFTISSPLRGAALAADIPFILHPLQVAMMPGSAMLRRLDAAPVQPDQLYAIYSYVRLRDPYITGSEAAVKGQTPWWLAAPAFSPPHEMAFQDPRILADILRRLHDETPVTTDPPTPIPRQ